MADADPSETRQWTTSPDFKARVGCASLTALLLPLWFLAIFLGVKADKGLAAVGVAAFLVVLAFAGSAIGVRRLWRAPVAVSLGSDGSLVLLSRRGRGRTVGRPRSIEVGALAGLASVRVSVDPSGEEVRLPGDLEDLDGFLAQLRSLLPHIAVTDRRAPQA